MKRVLLAGAALVVSGIATGASAQSFNGWYGAVDLGYHWPEGIETTSSLNAPDGQRYDWTFDHEEDWAGFVRLGYRVNPNWRVELEGGYRPGDIESVRGNGARFPGAPIGLCTVNVIRTPASPTCGAPDGSIESWSAMFNVIYDLNFVALQRIVPFVGVGVGANRISADVVGQFSNVSGVAPSIQNLVIDDEDTAFAWQALAGIAWNVSERLAGDLTHRWVDGGDVEFSAEGSNALQAGRLSRDRQSAV